MYVDMDNLATKSSSSLYDGSVNGLSYQQTFNMNNIYTHPDMLWLYSQYYKVTTPEVLTIWGNQYLQYIKSGSILYCIHKQYHKLVNTLKLTASSIDWLSLQLLHHLWV